VKKKWRSWWLRPGKKKKRHEQEARGSQEESVAGQCASARSAHAGMMETILNIGLKRARPYKAWRQSTKNERFAYRRDRRFVQMYPP